VRHIASDFKLEVTYGTVTSSLNLDLSLKRGDF